MAAGGWSSPEVSCGGGVTGGAFPRVEGLKHKQAG